MDKKEVSLKIESFLRFINQDEEHYSSRIESHPWEEILCALTTAKSQYPAKSDLIQFYIDRYKDIGDKKLEILLENSYDVEGLINDLNKLKEIFMTK